MLLSVITIISGWLRESPDNIPAAEPTNKPEEEVIHQFLLIKAHSQYLDKKTASNG
jgi:hypothetical protein